MIDIEGLKIGEGNHVIIAGPCSIENRDQLLVIAEELHRLNIPILRGGAFKPRTSPYSFQGLGVEGLRYMKDAKQLTGMLTVSEVMDPEDIPLVSDYVDILQVGSRNMFNYSFLKKLGKIQKPVFLKRGFMATVEEFLLSAEYLIQGGNKRVILCERGIRTFETITRNTLDINAVPVLKRMSHLPVFVDPCHASGRSDIVLPLSKAALVAGADGIMLEVHPNPTKALCDGQQSLRLEDMERIMKILNETIEFITKQGSGDIA
ncbi:MAG: 3-deoxy-7-phosphoheptulonate synthase [Candidatus Schekmanbacteria bacterium RBG_13_48_7]|uniref:3-deoxy-7-phosphoheptulonate synthase n=1 Tax=Candidatus Schekmanbacteria bacterium RBG_13_48_7 TaxID=1817878 RepID=A0A1F7RNS8_9BACT|nr:MAG: 3-deoxy-7-phosphoheptulonate synthase [Candidatus Schekmanbacteria bacterium RBG_13_48_7]